MAVLLLVFVLGLCVGSFVNVLIVRLPADESVVRPGSRCPRCGRALAWRDNVPLVSYALLRGRCRGCRAPISPMYPAVELAVGLLFVGNFLLAGPGWGADAQDQLRALARGAWIPGAVFTTLLLAIALTDARTYLIPDELSLGGAALGLVLSPLPGAPAPFESLVGAVVGGALLLAVAWVGNALFQREAMGGGDVKMLAMIGAFVGWRGVFLTLFLGALLGSLIYGPVVLYRRLRAGGATEPAPEPGHESEPPDLTGEASGGEEPDVDRGLVPFGFFLAPAAALTYYVGEEIVGAYLRFAGLNG